MTALRKVALIVVIVLIGVAVWYFNLNLERTTGPEVEVEAVERRNLEAIVSASGKIEPKLSVDISASTMGRVTRLAFSEGDQVESGQFLLEIDPEALRAAVDRGEAGLQASRSTQRQAEVSVQSAQVNLQLAKNNLERQENLWELRLISRETYELSVNDLTLRETELLAREVEVATQLQRIRQEEASLDSARYELTKVTITAPITGVVTRRNIEQGETVVVGTMNNQGTVLATIADLSVIEAEVEVDETDIPSIRLGQTAEVTIDALPDLRFAGLVTEIGNSPIQTDAGSGSQATTFKVVVTLKGEIPDVRPGFTCTADITTAVRSDSLAIPDPGHHGSASRSGRLWRGDSSGSRRAKAQCRTGGLGRRAPGRRLEGRARGHLRGATGSRGVRTGQDRHRRRAVLRGADRGKGGRPRHHRSVQRSAESRRRRRDQGGRRPRGRQRSRLPEWPSRPGKGSGRCGAALTSSRSPCAPSGRTSSDRS